MHVITENPVRPIAQAASPHRIHSLDLLRSLAILLVFMFHFRVAQSSDLFGIFGQLGWTGVDLFFVLSGYLISNQVFTVSFAMYALIERPFLKLRDRYVKISG